jgi:hypothetical protein
VEEGGEERIGCMREAWGGERAARGLQRPAMLMQMQRLFVTQMPAAVVAKAMTASPAAQFELGSLVPTEAEFR